MKRVNGWYMPDYDSHYHTVMQIDPNTKQYEYQQNKRNIALEYVKSWDCALDIGGNIGFWARDFCKKFNHVIAWEPLPVNAECFIKNLEGHTNWILHQEALSNEGKPSQSFYYSKDESGNASLDATGVMEGNSVRKLTRDHLIEVKVPVKTLDDYFEQLKNLRVGFLKVDSQGHEKEIIKGGLKVIGHHNMVINLELPTRNTVEKEYHEEVCYILKKNANYVKVRQIGKETIFTRS